MNAKICKSGEKLVGLAVPRNKGIAFYPLPAGNMVFYYGNELHEKFFLMEEISERVYHQVMEARTENPENLRDWSCEEIYKISDLLNVELELLGK